MTVSLPSPALPMPRITLSGGDSLPALGLGTWKAHGGEVADAVQAALELGYRHIDCASIYGNEAEIGPVLQRALGDGGVRREELWITSKLWNDCHSPEQVRPAVERSLAALGLRQLDLYLMHWPIAHRHGVLMPSQADEMIPLEQLPLSDTWAAMEDLVDAGLVRHIGVSNFSERKLADLLPHCRRRPVMNQVERHPWLQQNELLAFCRREGIALTAYSPLGSPPAGQSSPLLEDPAIAAIATGRGCSPAQLLLAWAIACGTAVIPKSVQRQRLAANLEAARLQLSPDDLEQLAAMDRGHRFVSGSFWDLPGSCYPMSSLWDEPVSGG